MPLTLKFIGAMRQISGKTQLTVNFQEGNTLKDLIARLAADIPQIQKIFGEQQLGGQLSSLVLVNGREISVLDGLETKISDGDEIVFIPVVHGG